MFRPDQPITSYKDDILGRKSFSEALGKSIISYSDKNSVVIGLFGAWGSGKTSVLNMALEYIEENSASSKDKPIIVKFNPWSYSDQNQLVIQFFKQLSVVLRRKDYGKEAKKAGEQLETYAKFFQPLTLIPGGLGTALGVALKGAEALGGAAKKWGDINANDLSKIRQQLNELLEVQPHRIIVVIDDIDRLNSVEIRQIFQLVKSLGDFPKTIYLLAFDKEVVKKALSEVQGGSGIQYLEKVVQVPFEIPLISKSDVEKLLFSQLDELIKDIPENKWSKTHWGNIYHSGLRHFFKNIRDVTRYINSLRFSFNMVKHEVNPVDFLAIVGIQVFLPEIYEGIRDNKDTFSGLLEGRTSSRKDQEKERYEEICSRNNSISKENLDDFLKRLFPKIETICGGTNYSSGFLESWRREGRVCSPDVFDVFFSLALPSGEISQREMETILSMSSEPDLFKDALLKLNDEGKIVKFLDRLEDYTKNTIPKEHIQNIVNVLMDIGDFFPEGNTGFFGTDTPMRILRIFYQLSQRFESHDERFTLFKQAIDYANQSLYTIIHEVSVQEQQHEKSGSKPDEKRTVNKSQIELLKKIALERIEKWAADGILRDHEKLAAILFRWRDWGDIENVRNFANEMIKDDDGLVKFITAFLSQRQSYGMSDYVARIHWVMPLNNLKEFIDIDKIVVRLRQLLSPEAFKEFKEKQKLAVTTFLDTYDGKIKDPF